MTFHPMIAHGWTVGVEPDYDFLSPEYVDFFRPGRGTAFQAPLWQSMIHDRLVPGLGARQYTICIRDKPSGRLLALLPLVVQRTNMLDIVQPADFGLCDYNAVVAEAPTLDLISQSPELLAELDKLLSVGSIVMFRKARNDGFDFQRLLRRAASSPCENASYHCEIGDDFDAWQRRTIRRKFSKELSRLQRQTEREHGSYEHRSVTDEHAIIEAFDFLKAVRAKRFEDDLIARDLYFSFYRDYAIAGIARGEAKLFVSYLKGKPIAFLFCLTGDGEHHATLIGSDIDNFGRISPGMQILFRFLNQEHANGHRTFDFGLGNTGYKSHLRVDETQLTNFTRAHSMAGAAMAAVYHHAKPLKNIARKFIPNVR